METTLHRQLKELYSADASQQEVTVDGYRIDAVVDGRLVEVQYGSLGAIRDKVQHLLVHHEVHVVKPLAARKYLITRRRKRGRIESARYSPSRQTYHNLFDDLVHFVGVFPHPRLTLEVVLTEQEEHRLPARKRRWRGRGYRVEDRKLRCIQGRLPLRSADDLAAMLPVGLPQPFSTEDLARASQIPRWLAQKMAYCLRKTNVIQPVSKRGNVILYRTCVAGRAAA